MASKHFLLVVLFVLSAVGLAACGSAATGGETPTSVTSAPDLTNTKWALVSFDGVNPAPVQTQSQPVTIEFQSDGRVGGFAGCNNFGGMYAVKSGSLMISDMASTLMACADNAVTQQEQRYLQALVTAGRFEISGNHLKIWYSEDGSSLNFTRAE